MTKALIYDAIRTPRGVAKEHGALHALSPFELLSQLYKALQDRTGLDLHAVDDVMLGCVSQYGEQGGNVARASILYAGWPDQVPGITLSRFCSSSLDAACMAFDRIVAGSASMLVTGGVESMSRVPMFSDKPLWMIDPAIAAKTGSLPLGNSADLIATQEGFKRADLDSFAVQSQQRAAHARQAGHFKKSLITMQRPDLSVIDEDETIRADTTLDQLAQLKPAFAKLGANGVDHALLKIYPALSAIDHQHTVGNSPAMADGASLVLIGAGVNDMPARAEIIGYRSCCGAVEQGLTGGIEAAQQLLKAQGMKAANLDLVEYNESFAGPSLKFIRDLDLAPAQVNVNGGAIALGHPMGATGGMLTGMLLDELERQDKELGMVSICGATGSGTAMLIRRL